MQGPYQNSEIMKNEISVNWREVSVEDWKGFVHPVNKAVCQSLYKEIVPSMRCVALAFYSKSKKVELFFYHDGKITKKVKEHYDSIFYKINEFLKRNNNFLGVIFKKYISETNSRLEHKEPITLELYSRKEPFDNNVDEENES